MLKLSITHTADPAKLITHQLQMPGGTMGSSPENDIVLTDEKYAIGKVQAALRINEQGDTVLVNLCSTSPLYLNGLTLAFKQQAVFEKNDQITLGSYVLQTLAETAAPNQETLPTVATTMAAVVAEPTTPAAAEAPTPAVPPASFEQALPSREPAPVTPPPAPPAEDIFADLLNSPGTLPIGAPTPSEVHPFEMASASDRNHANPVSLLTPQDVGQSIHQRDPLARLSHDGTESHRATIFTDNSPSTLRQTQALAELREEKILQTLKQTAYNSTNENH